MAKYWINWKAIVEKSVPIEAESTEQAFNIWQEGEYRIGDVEVDDEDIHGETIEIDNVEYYAKKFVRVFRGSGNGS